MNSQSENTNSKDDFVLKKTVKNVCFKDFWYVEFNHLAFKVKTSLNKQHEFITLNNH